MEWKSVQRKHFRGVNLRWDCFPFNGGRRIGVKEVLVSIFFSDIPNRSTAKDIFELFGCHGEVVEVVIPPRKNNLGKRFGFARFVGVEDAMTMAIRLDNILIDGNKIRANIPRFERYSWKRGKDVRRGRGEVASGGDEGGSREALKDNMRRGVIPRYGNGCSFVDVVKNVRRDEKPVLTFESKEEDSSRLSKAYVGEVHNPGSAYNIQTHFEVEGIFSIKVTPLGANLCLLEETEEGFIRELIGDGQTWWRQWFKEVRPWSAREVDSERVVWFRIYGVPCHAWNAEFFVKLANSIGSFVCIDENTANKACMDIARVMMRVRESFNLP
ncbi:uncharacterized protein LOC131597779 [Vicia villosa]|uniref:uncharacterized protein LOC131597779 n=1 Tax=Vicia villosa TaxID=3911 RepID=UPI00273B4678|nr:uncharacterized protein LOC131597779 [Vicia villosa]